MFDRKEYKKQARTQLKGMWKLPLAIAIVSGLISTAINILPSLVLPFHQYKNFSTIVTPVWIVLVGTITIASTYFYLEFTKDKIGTNLTSFFEGFSLWLKGTGAILWIVLWVFLWAILFVIPGIVKAYSYSQMFFILAENPRVGVRKAMRLSKEMTKGYKGDIFFLGLSFIGWYALANVPYILYRTISTGSLLNSIQFNFSSMYNYGVQTSLETYITVLFSLFIIPYYYTTHTYAYKFLKQAAIDRKALRLEDFE